MKLNNKLQEFVSGLKYQDISDERKDILQVLIDQIQSSVNAGDKVNLNFICTHNSRRSHLSQVWAQTMAAYFDIPEVYCYSGGTEATAIYPQVIETLTMSGFQIRQLSTGTNPVYAIKFADNLPAIIGFSKKHDDTFNPKSDIVAIMTCAHADENCPFIPAAKQRIPIRYEDPKKFDETPLKAKMYEERSRQISVEMSYIFSSIKL